MPLIATRGASSVQGFGQFAQRGPVNYIEDVFSTYLYTGTGASQTITNNIDLSTKGGLVWIKSRSNAEGHALYDTINGVTKHLISSSTSGIGNYIGDFTAFNTNGFTLGTPTVGTELNISGYTQASWTFRKQPKFFDIVTYTGDGTYYRAIAHNLGSVPGCIMVKNVTNASDWWVYHRGVDATSPQDYNLKLNSTSARIAPSVWGGTAPTSTQFTINPTTYPINSSSDTYVAYLFAHNAGGFGLTGLDNVISCGSFTTDGSGNATVNLGYEPQWILMKLNINGAVNWVTYDIMRGWGLGNVAQLYPNITQAEDAYTGGPYFFATATGFTLNGTFGLGSNQTNAYITIRRGPMKVPTDATKVFAPVTGSFSSPYTVTTNFPVDLTISGRTAGSTMPVNDRLRGGTTNSYAYLNTRLSDAELTGSGAGLGFQNNTAVIDTSWSSGGDAIWWNFRRAPSFFDEVCYTGTGSATTFSHNLQAVPELMIVKRRDTAGGWVTYSAATGAANELFINTTAASAATSNWNSTSPTSSVFSVGSANVINGSTFTYVAYLFATCAGVSKVGSYTGTATTKQIDCGFTAGARFVLIKRTDSTGDWYVWDSARGIVAGNDPYMLLNNSPQVTSTDYIDTYNAGFELSSTAPAAINANAGTYIFLAIA